MPCVPARNAIYVIKKMKMASCDLTLITLIYAIIGLHKLVFIPAFFTIVSLSQEAFESIRVKVYKSNNTSNYQ